MPHSVYLSCEAPGLLLANGRCLGSLQPQGPHPTRRVCLQGEAFLQFFPFSQAAMPSCLRFFPAPRDRPSRAAAALLDGLRAYV